MTVLKALDGHAATDLEMRKRVLLVRTSSMRSSNQRLRRGEFGNDIYLDLIVQRQELRHPKIIQLIE
jgi:hypothetical protein